MSLLMQRRHLAGLAALALAAAALAAPAAAQDRANLDRSQIIGNLTHLFGINR